jgi:hypothetical protein
LTKTLGKARIVEHQHAIGLCGLGEHLLHPLSVEVLLIPLHIGEKLLPLLGTGPRHGLGDGVTMLMGQLREQARGIAPQRFAALWPPKANLEDAFR